MPRSSVLLAACTLVVSCIATPAAAQVGPGLADLNAVPEATLATMPGMTPAIATAFVAARPFVTIVDANTFLVGQKLTPEQLTALYEKAFVHINLNTGTAPEILLIPRVAKRMSREFEEYRPWVAMAQFDKEIGKYVDATEVNRLKQYVFIPSTSTPRPTISSRRFRTSAATCCASSRSIGRGKPRRSSTRKSANTWARRRPRGCGAS